MKKYILALLLILSKFGVMCQISGTLIIAGVGKDGVIMVADSRGAMVGKNGSLIAYIDSIPKIFKLRNIYVATTGNSNIGNTFLSTIISDFNEIPIQKSDFESVVNAFVNYSNTLYPISSDPNSSTTSFIFIGSDSSNYMIQGYMRDLGYTRIVRKKVVVSDNHAVPYLDKFYEYSSLFPCDTLKTVFTNSLYEYADKSGLKYEIGGKLSVVCLGLNNQLKYFINPFSENIFSDFHSFINALDSGKRKFVPIVPNGDKEAIQAIKEFHK